MMSETGIFDGPIPGENFTSDTKNYPWHRPPEITDYDEAVAYSMKTLTDPEVGFKFMSILEAGYSIATATDIFVTQGIGIGKWTPDYAVLIAGPVARTLEIMAKSYGIEAEMGADRQLDVVDPEYLRTFRGEFEDMGEAQKGPLEAPQDDPEAPGTQGTPAMPGGFMSPPEAASEDEQMSMLGYGGDEGMEPPVEEPQQ